jgi:anti-sigma factor ChrR (cupin superfamily)
LTAGESEPYLAHLADCAECRAEFEESERIVAEIDCAVAQSDLVHGVAAAPSEALRASLLERVAVESERAVQLDRMWQRWSATPPPGASTEGLGVGLYAVEADGGEWEPVGIEGIAVKRLSSDAVRRNVTMLVRMAPGTAYPRHRHGGDEQCFVVSGDLRVGERRLRAGDFQMALAGSIHATQATDGGCVLFIISSQDDEMLG